MQAHLAQAVVLRRIVDACKDLVPEANLDVDPVQGVSMQAMDTSHVCLVALEMLPAVFEDFQCDGPMSLGVPLASLARVLRCVSPEDRLTLRAQDATRLSLTCVHSDESRTFEMSLQLMSIEAERMCIPDGDDDDLQLELPSAEFQRLCRDLASIGDTATLSCDGLGDASAVRFTASGELGEASWELRPAPGRKVVASSPYSQSFALRYLAEFTKATPLAQNVSIRASHSRPLRVSYSIGADSGLTYFLAPKVDDDGSDDGAPAADGGAL